MEEFKKHLYSYLDKTTIDKLVGSFSLPSKHAALLNANKMDDESFKKLFPNVTPHPIVPHAYIYDKNEYELGKTIFHELGCFYLQEPSAMTVSYLLHPNPNEIILDLCAAPGGKTIQSSFLMQNKGVIISNDLSKERTKALEDNITRLGIGNVIITNNNFENIYTNFLSYFDKIILDAPCSGSGMFRKDDKMIQDWSLNKVMKNSITQMRLIEICYEMLKPGGLLAYSTCSYSFEEDEAVINHLLEISDAKIFNIKDNELFYKGKNNIGIHLFPHLFPGEGHYICLIQKPGNSPLTNTTEMNSYKKLLPSELSSFHINNFNNVLFGLNKNIKYKGISIVRYGLKIGEVFKDKIVYDYHLSRYINHYDSSIELSNEEVQSYLLGNELAKINKFKGNVLLTYRDIPIDFSKTDGLKLKNHYPKYLKKRLL